MERLDAASDWLRNTVPGILLLSVIGGLVVLGIERSAGAWGKRARKKRERDAVLGDHVMARLQVSDAALLAFCAWNLNMMIRSLVTAVAAIVVFLLVARTLPVQFRWITFLLPLSSWVLLRFANTASDQLHRAFNEHVMRPVLRSLEAEVVEFRGKGKDDE